MITLDDVSRSFVSWSLRGRREVRAVTRLSLRVDRGEIFGLLGPNGSGKTTTIAMLLGLLRPDSGTIEVLGSRPGHRDIRGRIGYLPEEFAPPDNLSGEEILAFYGGLFNLAPKTLRERADRLLGLLDLEDARRRRFREYSKGMRRRVGLAQALLHEPELVILDEPTNGLDPIGVRTVKSLLRDLRSRGRTVLIASHVLPELEEICDRLAILNDGACICTGRTVELLSSRDTYQVVVEGVDAGQAREAADVLEERDFRVRAVEPVRQSLESLFLARVEEGGGKDDTSSEQPTPPSS